jgi:hypothetical protein
MKKYGILLSAAEHKSLRQLAAERGMTMQDIARSAVLNAMGTVDISLASPTPAILNSLNALA